MIDRVGEASVVTREAVERLGRAARCAICGARNRAALHTTCLQAFLAATGNSPIGRCMENSISQRKWYTVLNVASRKETMIRCRSSVRSTDVIQLESSGSRGL